jgi:hypothetical protein
MNLYFFDFSVFKNFFDDIRPAFGDLLAGLSFAALGIVLNHTLFHVSLFFSDWIKFGNYYWSIGDFLIVCSYGILVMIPFRLWRGSYDV